MSRFWPHSELAEDQRYATAILATHVLHRGFTTGALAGALATPAVLAYRRRQAAKAPIAVTAGGGASSLASGRQLGPVLLRSSGAGAVAGVGLMALALAGRMRGREAIEWNDRSWRLMENGTQVLVDDFSIAGAAAGLASGLRAGATRVGWQGPVARAGLGSLAGTAAYMVFQYGMRPVFGGK